ncbi:MAG: VWA domain-containing protein [Lachnospiraceae bacterium]|nr:VWA domain-containing protein [Lachnospiraceae bacterium]
MIFESFWPLLFLAAVPVIIILYLLKPKGIDQLISSNLLWKKLLKNEHSRTFFEKFVHNILMYLQIAIIALLIIALMSPFIRTDGVSKGRRVLLIDTGGRMQHVGTDGKTRLEEAVEQACDYVKSADNTQFSVVTADGAGTELLAVDLSDPGEVAEILRRISCTDRGGSLTVAQNILDTLSGSEEEGSSVLMVYTDGAGAAAFEGLTGFAEKELYVVGEPAANVANEYTVYAKRPDGLYDVMVSTRNYSDEKAAFDVGLYDDTEKLIALKQMTLDADETKVCLFEQLDWQGQTLRAEVSGMQTPAQDTLEADNTSWAVKGNGSQINGLLVSGGNTFLEKAYLAVTGSSVTKAGNDAAADGQGGFNVVIYDAGQEPHAEGGNKLIFRAPRAQNASDGTATEEVLENIVVHTKNTNLTTGLSDFTIGVNKAYSFSLPEWAESFLEYEGKCVGYYGERNGRKEVVVGFDIRESDFPLRAEFPVFLANAIVYLSDTSWLDSTVYYAGDEITLRPWADAVLLENKPRKAGLYRIGNEEYEEYYAVRFQTASESDGRAQAQSVTGNTSVQLQKVKHTLRNVFIGLALILLIAEWILYVYQMRYRGKFYLAVRGIVFLCLVLALFGIRIRLGRTQTATVFVVDISNSNGEHLDEMNAYLKKTIYKMPSGNVYGIVTFGKDALVEQFLSDREYSGMMTLPEKTATNFEEAMSRALTLIPGDAAGRIVVLTDGKQTQGDIRNMAQALMAGKTEYLTLLYEDEEKDDAYIENVTLPAYLHPGDKYAITVLTESNYDTEAVIAVYHGSTQTAGYSVHLNKGSNRFVFNDQVKEDVTSGSMESLRVQIQAKGDNCPENDSYAAYSVVEAAPRILVVSGKNTSPAALNTVLNTAGCDYTSVSALNAPETIDDMLAYKAIILVDTYIDDLPKGFLDQLETYVKDYGCGFVCCGGDNSFALGGYRDTVLETVLPVDMRLKTVNEMQTMAMVMVIDHSGSMGGGLGSASNLDVAIRAATVAVDNLQDSDYVGVLTFDDQYDWQVELTPVDDRTAIKNKIKAIPSGGGTTIKPALVEAYQVISQSTASKKHVVLLTDGMGETTNYNDVIKDYANGGVTLSTVAVGSGSDTQLLEKLAKSCGGRYYYSDLSTDIPKIFAQEVFLGGDSYIQNGEFTLAVSRNNELTNNLFADGWPAVYGFISATPKTASSQVIQAVEKDAPILTTWQYGLGRSVAWNTDVTGQWSGGFIGKDDYVQLWKRIVDYAAGNANMGGDNVNVETVGDSTKVVYRTQDYTAQTEVLATVVDPAGANSEVRLYATAPGIYETELPTGETGMYHLNVRRTEDGEIRSYLTTAAVVQFSDEYKFNVTPEVYLNFANAYGKVIGEDDPVWTTIESKNREKRTLTNFLLGLAILLFLADVAMRRFQYVPQVKVRAKRRTAQHTADTDAQTEEQKNTRPTEQSDVQSTEPKKPVPQKPKKTSKKKEADVLDTSQLLKKKDDRNI